jgi:hypothetical protein
MFSLSATAFLVVVCRKAGRPALAWLLAAHDGEKPSP